MKFLFRAPLCIVIVINKQLPCNKTSRLMNWSARIILGIPIGPKGKVGMQVSY